MLPDMPRLVFGILRGTRALITGKKHGKIPPKGRDGVDEKNTPLASEMYEDLKQHTEFLRKTVCRLMIVICILIAALSATNIYHI